MLISGCCYYKYINKDKNKVQKFAVFLGAFFSELYQCASCGGCSQLAIAEFLITGIITSIELISVKDKTNNMDHAFVLINRQMNDPIINAKNVISLDAWSPVNRVMLHKVLTKNEFLNDAIQNVSAPESVIRFDRNFNASEWQEVSDFFHDASENLSLNVVADALAKTNRKISPQDELKLVKAALDRKADFYAKLASDREAIFDNEFENELEQESCQHTNTGCGQMLQYVCMRLFKFYPSEPNNREMKDQVANMITRLELQKSYP